MVEISKNVKWNNVYLASVCVRVCVFKNGEVALNFESRDIKFSNSFCWSFFFFLSILVT